MALELKVCNVHITQCTILAIAYLILKYALISSFNYQLNFNLYFIACDDS